VNQKRLLELINEFSKVAGYTITIYSLVTLLHTHGKITEKEIMKEAPLIITTKLGITMET
jgi:hypothetical protein